MIFNPNEPVKVLCKIGLNKAEKWYNAVYVQQADSNYHEVRYHDIGLIVSDNKIKKLKPVQEEELISFEANNQEKLFDSLKEIVKELKIEHLVNIENFIVHVDTDEVKSLVGFIEKPCWSISAGKQIPATLHEPENYDEVFIGKAFTNEFAIKLMIKYCIENTLDVILENKQLSNFGEIDF